MHINRDTLLELGIRPECILEKIEMMNPVDVTPTYLRGYLHLLPERQELASSLNVLPELGL